MKLDRKFYDSLTDADFKLAALIMMEKVRRQLPATASTQLAQNTQQRNRARGASAKTAGASQT